MRIEQVTFTRFIGALIVVIGHYGQPFIKHYFGDPTFFFIEMPGIVSFFHLLSGFIIMFAYGRSKNGQVFDKKRFFANRFARAYPLFFLSLIAMIVILLYMNIPINVPSLFLNIFLLQSWIPGNAKTFNTAAWSISVEIVFYVLFPFILNKVFKYLNLLQVAAICVFLWSGAQSLTIFLIRNKYVLQSLGIDKEFIIYNPLLHMHEFLIGTLCAVIFLNNKDKFKGNEIILCFFVLTVLLAFLFPIYGTYHNGFLCILFGPLILLLSSCSGRITSLFQIKPFTFLGECSFAIYILQIPCYMACRIVLPLFNIQGDIYSFPYFFVILLFVSVLAYQYIEIPAKDLIKKLLKA